MLHTQTPGGGVAVGLALTPDAVDQAERLVHEIYVGRGYRDAAPARRPSPTSAAKTTVFVARASGAVVATLSLLADSVRGLPADALYATELAPLRGAGRRLAEVSALAVASGWRGAALTLLRPLVQLVGIYARDVGHVDELCIAVHPRHAAFYERGFGFVRFGGEKAYAAVNGAPAIGLRLNLQSPPLAGALSGSLFAAADIARVRSALDADLRRRAAAGGPLVQMFQFREARRSLARLPGMEVC